MHDACLCRQNLIGILAVCISQLASIAAYALAQTAPITSSGLNTQISGPNPSRWTCTIRHHRRHETGWRTKFVS